MGTGWTTTANGLLAAFIGAVGPLSGFLAALQAINQSTGHGTANYTLAIVGAALTSAALVARAWIGLLQHDAPPPPPNLSSTIPTSKIVPALLLCALLLPFLSGCATQGTNPPTAPAVTALNVLNEVQSDVLAAQNAEIAAVQAGLIDQATNQVIQKALKQEAIDATALAQAISTAGNGATVQAKVDALLADLQTDVTNGVGGIKDTKTKAEIVAGISAAEIAVNGIMSAYTNGGK